MKSHTSIMLFRMREDPKEGLEETSWSRITHCPFFLAFFCHIHIPRRCVRSTSQLHPESQTLRSATSIATRFLTLTELTSKGGKYFALEIYLFFPSSCIIFFFLPHFYTLLYPKHTHIWWPLCLGKMWAGQSSVFSNYQFQADHKEISNRLCYSIPSRDLIWSFSFHHDTEDIYFISNK